MPSKWSQSGFGHGDFWRNSPGVQSPDSCSCWIDFFFSCISDVFYWHLYTSIGSRELIERKNWAPETPVSCMVNNQKSRYGYGSIPIDTFLVGWTSIYQLFWGSLGTRVLTHPHIGRITCRFCRRSSQWSGGWKRRMVVGGVSQEILAFRSVTRRKGEGLVVYDCLCVRQRKGYEQNTRNCMVCDSMCMWCVSYSKHRHHIKIILCIYIYIIFSITYMIIYVSLSLIYIYIYIYIL